MGEPLATLCIDRHFRGPPRSGNGGYVCGRLAEFVDGDCRARLLRPPPLERELSVVADADGVSLLDGESLVAQARAWRFELALPAPVGLEEARARSRDFRGFESHAFPSCFVCGPQREPGDGLRIFPAPARAMPWSPALAPAASLAGEDGRIQVRYLWAALTAPAAGPTCIPAGASPWLGTRRILKSASAGGPGGDRLARHRSGWRPCRR
jgi:hypothetical protein